MYIVIALITLGVLVVIHELGHFALAKLNGIKVEQFSVGMGPKLFGVKKGETEYLLKALPIGGYVKMLGDEGGSTDERAFFNKKPLSKLSVVLAGPIMNLIIGVILFAIVGASRGIVLPAVGDLSKGFPAQEAGLQKGDKIVGFNNKKIATWEDFSICLSENKGEEISLTYERNNGKSVVKLIPEFDEKEKRYKIGIVPKVLEKPGFVESIKYGFDEAGTVIRLTGNFFKNIFKGKFSKDDVGGPVSVIKITGAVAKNGFISLLMLAAYISLQFGIMNLLPFPALDGGYIIVFLFELITGKKIDENKIGFINYIGFAILMGIMILVTIKDIMYPIKI